MNVESSNEKISNIIAIYNTLEQRWRRFRQEAMRNYRYVMSDQLDEEVKKQLARERRPAKVFNLMQDKIVAIAGTIENNHSYMKAVPVREGDEQLAQMHTVLVSDWAMKNCQGYQEIAKAALDAAIAKIGWTNNYISFKHNPEGEWITESFDPFMIMFDPMARKKDLSDAKYYVVSAFYTAQEILSLYKNLSPEMKAKIKEEDARISETVKDGEPKSWSDRIGGITDVVTNFWRNRYEQKDTVTDWVDARSGIYRVVEFHDLRNVSKKVVYSPITRGVQVLDDKKAEQTDEEYGQYVGDSVQKMQGVPMDIDDEQRWVTVIVPGLLADDVVYEKAYPVQGAGWQHKPIFCYNFHPDPTRTAAIVDVMIDPQDAYNQRSMTALEVVMDAVNPSWKVPKGAIDNEDLQDWKSKARGVLKFWKGSAPPEPIHPLPEAIQGLKMLSDEAHEITRDVTGITPNSQGQADTKNESGRLFAQRVRQSMVMMSYYMGNISFSMSQVFNYCDRNLQQFVKLPRAVRILDKKNQPEWINLNMQTIQGVINDMSQGEFDFIVDSNQVGETAKQMQRAEIMDLLQIMPHELVPWDKLLKLFDFADVDEWVQYVGGMMGQAQALSQQKAKLDIAQHTAATVGALDAASKVPQAQEAA